MDAGRHRDRHESGGVLRKVFPEWEGGAGAGTLLAMPLLAVMAGLFARTHVVFGTYPLAFALLGVVRGNPLLTFAGAAVGALTMPHDGWVYALFYLMELGIRFLFSAPRRTHSEDTGNEGYFRELPQLQITAVILTGTAVGIWQLISTGITTYTLMFAASSAAVPAICAALFTGVFAAELEVGDLLGTRQYGRGEVPFAGLAPLYVEIGMLTLLSAFSYALCFYSVFGLSLGHCAATLFTLFVARRWGALRGCVGGMLTAISVVPTFAPVFGILGLLAGAVFPYGTGYALTVGIGGATLCASYFGGVSGLLGLVPEMCVTALLTWPFYLKMKRGEPATASTAADDQAVTYATDNVIRATDETGVTLREISDALLTVSDNFRREGLSEEKPDLTDYFLLCDRVCNRYCRTCPESAGCWERDGRESYFPAGCAHEQAILRAIRAEAAELCGDKHKSAHSTLVATEYMMLSRLLGEEARRFEDEERMDTALAARLHEKISTEIPALSGAEVIVRGAHRKRISIGARDARTLGGRADDIVGIFEEETGLRLESPVYEELNKIGTLRMNARRRFGLTAASAVSSLREGEISGDVVTWFDAERGGYAHALLSDGMGSGRRAARASQLVCNFMEQFLGAGCGVPHTTEMLHHLLRGRSEETSATVDLFTLDTFSGHAEFLKCGAVSSYIKRGGTLYRVRAKTPPVGILRDYGGESVPFEMQAGDLVILMSDGIAPDAEEAPWLMQALGEDFHGDLDRAVHRIIAMAAQKNGAEDDRSILMLEICEPDARASAGESTAA